MEKYLRYYAEPETAALDGVPAGEPWQNVIVIPACNEEAGFLRPPPACGGRSLMILVINESVTAPAHVSLKNQALAQVVQTRFERVWRSATESGLSLFRDRLAPRDVLLVDRFSDGRRLPVKGGVGHARKIGADLATGLIRREAIRSAWIHCTDADVQLPETYFTASQAVQDTESKIAALIYPFHHVEGQPAEGHHVEDRNAGESGNVISTDVILATQLYELSLRYYVAGMKYAGSPYAFHTIGSTMAVSACHYAKVRGFPKRAAAEDFYLLNKLAKVGFVLELGKSPDCEPIRIESRRSDRVPFGTGAAVTRITEMADPEKDFRFYHPAVFEMLRLWLQSLPRIWQARSSVLNMGLFPDPGGDDDQRGKQQVLLAALREIKTEQALEHAFRQSRSLDQFCLQMHTWFDAFRTLKLIHVLRDSHLPSISYAQLEASDTFCELQTKDMEILASH
jgi:hypothetical protein